MGIPNFWKQLCRPRGTSRSPPPGPHGESEADNSGDPVPEVFVRAAWADLPPGTSVGPGLVLRTNAFATVTDGIAAVADAGSVHVAAGVYAEPVTVTKTIQLLGAQRGVDARTRSGSPHTESVIRMSGVDGPVSLLADGIVFDSLTVQGNGSHPGIATSGSNSGYLVLNNIVRDNVFGLYLNSNRTTLSTVRHNVFQKNTASGAHSGNGIYADQGSARLHICENRFVGHTSGSLAFAGAPGTQHDFLIVNNDIVSDAPLAMVNTTNATIMGNTIIGTAAEALSIQANNRHVDLQSNRLHQNVYESGSPPPMAPVPPARTCACVTTASTATRPPACAWRREGTPAPWMRRATGGAVPAARLGSERGAATRLSSRARSSPSRRG